MKIKIYTDIDLPVVPNYLTTVDGRTISISSVTEEDLKNIGEAWVEQLIKKSKDGSGFDDKIVLPSPGNFIQNVKKAKGNALDK